MKIIVIGCGVMGLTSGLCLLEAGYEVTIWARELPPNTTSNRAAAIWYPYQVAPEDKVVAWGQRSYEIYCELAQVQGTGVALLQGLELFREVIPDPAWAGYLRQFWHVSPSELPAGYADGYIFEVPLVETSIYLDYLQRRFLEMGGTIQQREVATLAEPLAECSLVVNCSGLGSRALLNDLALYPLRGQIIRVARNTTENSFLFDDTPDTTTYIIPRSQDIILGGTIQKDNWSLEPDEATAAEIMERCVRLRPDLRQAEILEHAVGLRPGRKTVRLEAEPQPGGGLVVHNYGHGGGGITLSWGCAEEVISLLDSQT